MLRELDDPTPPSFDDGMRRKVRGRVRARRQRRLAVGGAAGAVVLATGGLYARAANRLGDVERLEVAGTEAVPAGGPRTILLVGTDSAVGMDVEGTPLEGRPTYDPIADTMVLLRIDGDQVRMLSLPRDLDVGDPLGAPVRLNSILPTRGPEGLLAVVEQHFGVPVDHLAMVDLGGFQALVDQIGGVELATSLPLRDENSGLDLPQAGCQRLSGSQALSLVRARHLFTLVDGVWVADGSNDIGRTDRQRAFLVAALAAVQDLSPDPITVDQLAGWAVEHLTVDSELDTATLGDLLRTGLSLDPSQIQGEVLPSVSAPRDGAAVLRPAATAADTLSWFLDGTIAATADAPPGEEPLVSADPVQITPC